MLRTLGLLAFAAEFFKGGLGQTELARAEGHAKNAEKAGIHVSPHFIQTCGWVMIAASVALQIPWLRRPAALVLAGLLVPITYIGHRFWEVEDPALRRRNETQFLKNTTMLGGALYIAGTK
jgi:uncharacterized membrane protein YphA (DoxX/SURF4 family)